MADTHQFACVGLAVGLGTGHSARQHQFGALRVVGVAQRLYDHLASSGDGFGQGGTVEPVPRQSSAEQIAGSFGHGVYARMRDDVGLRAGDKRDLHFAVRPGSRRRTGHRDPLGAARQQGAGRSDDTLHVIDRAACQLRQLEAVRGQSMGQRQQKLV